MTDLARARAAKTRLRETLRSDDGVVGVGLCRTSDGYGVKVNVRGEPSRRHVPTQVDGVEVRVDVVGPITARS